MFREIANTEVLHGLHDDDEVDMKYDACSLYDHEGPFKSRCHWHQISVSSRPPRHLRRHRSPS